MISFSVSGLRDSMGRFANMENEGCNRAVMEEMLPLREEIEHLYREAAPKGKREDPRIANKPHFAEGLTASVDVTTAGATGHVETNDSTLREHIKFGHKAFVVNAKHDTTLGYTGTLAWVGGKFGPGWHFARNVLIPAQPPNPWEEAVDVRVEELLHERMGAIARHILIGLSG